MKISEGLKNIGYTLLFIIGAVVIYIAQHECVKYGYDAFVSAADSVESWVQASK